MGLDQGWLNASRLTREQDMLPSYFLVSAFVTNLSEAYSGRMHGKPNGSAI